MIKRTVTLGLFLAALLLAPIVFAAPPNTSLVSNVPSGTPSSTDASTTALTLWSPIPSNANKGDVQNIADLLSDEYIKTGSPLAYWRLELLKIKFGVSASLERQKHIDLRGETARSISNAAFAGSPDTLFLNSKKPVSLAASSTRLRSIPLTSVAPIEVPSRIWVAPAATSSAGNAIPEIFHIAPADHPVIYARKLSALRDASLLFDTIGAFPAEFFPLSRYEKIYAQILGRLGVADTEMLERASDEVIFVVEDLSFVPATNFALIIRPSGALSGVENALVPGVGIRGPVGNFFVLSTSRELLNRIAGTGSGDIAAPALANEGDFRYVWSTLRVPRDGFAFLSERTMRRLVSPSWFVNAHRRRQTAGHLDTLQHLVFAYRSITGNWPTALVDMMKEGYVDARITSEDPELFETLDQYLVGLTGVVEHKEWGTLAHLEPVGDVPVGMVPPAEVEAYKNVWSRDPGIVRTLSLAGTGMTFSFGPRFVTEVFLPRGDHAWPLSSLENVFGGDPHQLTMVDQIPVESSLVLLGGVNMERFLLDSVWGEPLRLYVASTTPPALYASTTEFLRAQYAALSRDGKRTTMMNALNAYMHDAEIDQLVDPFEIFAGEVLFGVPMTAVGTTTTSMGGYLGVTLKNATLFRQLLHDLYIGLARTIGGVSDPKEPEQVERDDGVYTVFPTGIASLYATFLSDRVYGTLDEPTVRALLKGLSGKVAGLSALQSSLLSDIGRTRNLLLLLDLSRSDAAATQFIAAPEHWASSVDVSKGAEFGAYLADVNDVIAVMNDPAFAPEIYFVPIGNRFLGLPLDVNEGRGRLGGVDITEVNFTTAASGTPGVSLPTLYTSLDQARLVSALTRARGLGAGLTFTESGAFVDLAVPNPFASAHEGTATPRAGWNFPKVPFVVVWYLLGALLVLAVAFGVSVFMRRLQGPKTIAELIAEKIEKENDEE